MAKWFLQCYGLDYFDLFSPLAQNSSLRLFLSTVALRKWEMNAVDIKTAFLNGILEEKLYMEQLEHLCERKRTHGVSSPKGNLRTEAGFTSVVTIFEGAAGKLRICRFLVRTNNFCTLLGWNCPLRDFGVRRRFVTCWFSPERTFHYCL